jgi:outer membrane lipoprotein carrier protein
VMLFTFIAWFAIATAFAQAPASGVHEIARAVDDHYNHLRTLQAEFTESYRGAGPERTESGTLLLKKPGKMRWEYRSPKEKLFLSDGKAAWFYVPGDHQVRKVPLKQLDDLRSPIAFLLGHTRLEKELQGLSKAPDMAAASPGNVTVRGTPKSLSDRVSQVVLEINRDRQIVRILIEQIDSSVTEYRFTSLQEGIELPEKNFRFAAPSGVEVVEGELGP